MRFHPLPAEARCPVCGVGLTFVRVRAYGDLYHCASGGSCRCAVLHYKGKGRQGCGTALLHGDGTYGKWTACEAVDGE
jgi:hypothetical protein